MATMTTNDPTRAEKRRINRELRALQRQRKPYLSGAWIVDRGWQGVPYCVKPCSLEGCEGCLSREYGFDQAEPLTTRITELKAARQRLDGEVPAPSRPAVVTTGRGEQLVIFV